MGSVRLEKDGKLYDLAGATTEPGRLIVPEATPNITVTFNGVAKTFAVHGTDAQGAYHDATNTALGAIISAQGPEPTSPPCLNGMSFPTASGVPLRLRGGDWVTWN